MTEANLIQTDLGGGDIELSAPSKLPVNPLVSIWMITYNHARYIREALDSVLMQQVDFPYEICLGEDGSTDGTREICLEYARTHPDKLRLFLRDRTNPDRQRFKMPFMHNSAGTFDACRGKYIAMLEGDDYWTSQNKLAYQVKVLESCASATVSAHYVFRLSDGEPWGSCILPSFPLPEFSLRSLFRDRFYVHTSSIMFRRCFGIEWKLFADAPCGDVPLLASHLSYGCGILCPKVMSVYRVNPGGVFAQQRSFEKSRRAISLWNELRALVSPELQPIFDLSYVKLLVDVTAESKLAIPLKETFAYFLEAASMSINLDSSIFNRIILLAGACESLLVPRFRRLRRRCMDKLQIRRIRHRLASETKFVLKPDV